MRQSDGAELLGPNDPRSASIGVIYVDANDNRQSVLTAILTQDKFGREEVVVVLPENNRAFQRPVDFDGLRNMRRGLKSEIVFIAPSGPGPAQFARQRRFPVYSSPENFVQSLKIEAAANEAGKKRGFLLRRKPKPADASTTSSTANGRIEQKPASPLPVNLVPALCSMSKEPVPRLKIAMRDRQYTRVRPPVVPVVPVVQQYSPILLAPMKQIAQKTRALYASLHLRLAAQGRLTN